MLSLVCQKEYTIFSSVTLKKVKIYIKPQKNFTKLKGQKIVQFFFPWSQRHNIKVVMDSYSK